MKTLNYPLGTVKSKLKNYNYIDWERDFDRLSANEQRFVKRQGNNRVIKDIYKDSQIISNITNDGRDWYGDSLADSWYVSNPLIIDFTRKMTASKKLLGDIQEWSDFDGQLHLPTPCPQFCRGREPPLYQLNYVVYNTHWFCFTCGGYKGEGL
jgi:hypothetical protein